MKIKRYLDKDMRNVLRRVREDQGPDAVILSNRRVEEGIEVIAAIDYDEALIRHALGVDPASEAPLETDRLAQLAEDDVTTVAAEKAAPAVVATELDSRPVGFDQTHFDVAAAEKASDELALATMQNEMKSMRSLLETQVSGLVWKDTTRRSPVRAQILRNLARIGLAPDIANIVVDRLEPIDDVKSIWHEPLKALAHLLPVREDRLITQGGIAALIGPTGVGKTTRIAKIAARFAMQHGVDEVALVSADAYRIGAREHLMAFANLIGVNVYSASTSNELTDLLVRLAPKKRLIMIDTEGRSQRDQELANRLAAYGRNQDRVRFYLTLSAATQEAALDETLRRFRQVPLEGAVVTKIDEAGQLGCLLSTLIRHDLPAIWLSDGQRIPEDLYAASTKRLWLVNQAIECINASEPQVDERTMAEDYTRVSVAHG